MPDPDDSFDLATLRAVEESGEDLFDELPCGYLSSDLDGRIVRANRTLLSWTGHLRDDLVGRERFQDLLTAGGRIYYETHYAPLLRMQGAVREIALDLRCADGRALPVIASSKVTTDPRGRPVLVRTTLFEARDRRQYERELLHARERAEAADRAKADFISTVSHEIRTPLHAVMAVGHLLESTGLSPAQEKYVRILRSSSQGLLGLVDDILDFNRLEAGKLELDEKPFELRPLLEEVSIGQRVRAEQKGVELEAGVDPGCPEHLIGDRGKIVQILNNLIGNAVKFTERGGVRVVVTPRSVEAGEAVLGFSVADSGIGISGDRLPHVFESFTQASPEVTSKYGGTGLGLAITRRLVELHGSELAVESAVGRGSVFSFDLRLRLATPVLAGGAPAPDAAAEPLAGRHLLIVDDSEVNLVVLGGLLRGWGAAVDVAHGGQEAIERVRGGRYDAVLMDLRMPTVDGFAATRRIRALPGGGSLPILAISASTRMSESSELQQAGLTDFVGKPVNPELLLDKILRCLPVRE